MDIRFTEEELAFQAEVKQFFASVMDDERKAKLHGVEASPDLKGGMIANTLFGNADHQQQRFSAPVNATQRQSAVVVAA